MQKQQNTENTIKMLTTTIQFTNNPPHTQPPQQQQPDAGNKHFQNTQELKENPTMCLPRQHSQPHNAPHPKKSRNKRTNRAP